MLPHDAVVVQDDDDRIDSERMGSVFRRLCRFMIVVDNGDILSRLRGLTLRPFLVTGSEESASLGMHRVWYILAELRWGMLENVCCSYNDQFKTALCAAALTDTNPYDHTAFNGALCVFLRTVEG